MSQLTLMYKKRSRYAIVDRSEGEHVIEYRVYLNDKDVDSSIHGINVSTKIRSFVLHTALCEVRGSVVVPLLTVNFGDVTPHSGVMYNLVNRLCYTKDLTLDTFTTAITDVQEEQKAEFAKEAIRKMKGDLWAPKKRPHANSHKGGGGK